MYEKKVSVAQPTAVLGIFDDSGSMGDSLFGTSDPKFKWNERYFGLTLKELLNRCMATRNGAPIIKARYYLGVTIYGSQTRRWGREVMPIDEAVEAFAKDGNSLGLGGKLGGTDAKAAFELTYDVAERVVVDERFKKSFPLLVLHLTDGESQSDARPVAQKLMQLSTEDGPVLVANAYIGTQTKLNYRGPDDFPGYVTIDETGPNPDCNRLFDMSSEIPPSVYENLKADGIFPQLRPGARMFFDVRTKEMLCHVFQVVGSQGSRADR